MNTATETKKESKLVPVFALWERKDKNGNDFFTGKTEGGDIKLVAFYNKKRTMKDSDINVFKRGEDGKELIPFARLWCNASKAGKKYLSGKQGDIKVIGFFRENHTASQPYISIYVDEKAQEQTEETPF